jgi:sugar/nucleoside kinase (ribokinase family)
MKYQVYGVGNAIVDYEIEVSNDFFKENQVEKGLMTLVDEARQAELINVVKNKIKKRQSGGSAANSIISLAQLGGKAFYACKIASDEDGKFYLNGLQEAGVDTNLAPHLLPDGTTGKCLVMVSPDADRTMNTYLGITSEFSTNELDNQAIAASEYVFLEGYLVTSPTGLVAMKEAKKVAKESGAKVSLSFSDPAMVKYFRDQMVDVVGDGVDLLFCNEEEAMLYTNTSDLEAAKTALKKVASQFVITLGKNGALVYDGAIFSQIESFPTKAIDTTGAGDMFCGAFLYGITHGHSFEQAGRLASRASSAVVSQFGPRLELSKIQKIAKEILG